MNTYLGLDLSLNATGWSIGQHDPIKGAKMHVFGGCVRTPEKSGKQILSECERLDFLERELATVVTHYGATHVCIEDYAYGATGKLASMGEWGGIVRLMLYRIIPRPIVYKVNVSQLKNFATSKKGAEKHEVILRVFQRWQMDFSDDNMADAFVLMMMATALADEYRGELMSVQKEAVDKIKLCQLMAPGPRVRIRPQNPT